MDADTATAVVRGECVGEAAEMSCEPLESIDLKIGCISTDCMATTRNILLTFAVVCEVLAHMVAMSVGHHC